GKISGRALFFGALRNLVRGIIARYNDGHFSFASAFYDVETVYVLKVRVNEDDSRFPRVDQLFGLLSGRAEVAGYVEEVPAKLGVFFNARVVGILLVLAFIADY